MTIRRACLGLALSWAFSGVASAQAPFASVSGVSETLVFPEGTSCVEAAAQLRADYRVSTKAGHGGGLILVGRGKKGVVAILNCFTDEVEPEPTPDPEPVATPTPTGGPIL